MAPSPLSVLAHIIAFARLIVGLHVAREQLDRSPKTGHFAHQRLLHRHPERSSSAQGPIEGHVHVHVQVPALTGFSLVRRVHWPLLKKPLAAATLLVLVDVMKELPATLVLRPFNTDTLAVMAYQLARDERLGEAALPSLALVLVGLLPVILLSRTLRRS